MKLRGIFIPGLAFASGHVFLLADWEQSPLGPYQVLFWFPANGRRLLLVSRAEAMALVSALHRFDRAAVASFSTGFAAPDLYQFEVREGDGVRFVFQLETRGTAATRLLSRVAQATPFVIANRRLYQRASSRLIAPLLRSGPLRLEGRTETGARLGFVIHQAQSIVLVRASHNGEGLGEMVYCTREVDLGDFRLTLRPFLNRITMTIDERSLLRSICRK